MSQFIEMFKDKEPNGKISDLVDTDIKSVKKSFSKDDSIEYIDISSVDAMNRSIKETTQHVVHSAPSRAQQCVVKGDILVSTVRPVNRNIALINRNLSNLVASTGFCVLRPKANYREYLLSIVTSDKFTDKMCDIASGGLYPAVNNGDVLSYEIFIPDEETLNRVTSIYQQTDKSEFDGIKSQFIEMFNGEFPMERWEECLTITNGKKYDGEYQETGTYPICGSGGIMGYGEQKLCPKDTVILGRKGNINSPIYMESDYWIVDTAFCLDVDKQKLQPKFFYYWCILFDFTRFNKQGVLPSLTKNDLLKIEIPIPPMDLQTKFVNIQEQADKSESAQKLVRNINYN